MPKKIIISINSSWNFINFRAGLVRALVAAGYEIVALAPEDEYTPRLADLGCRFIPLPMDRHGKSPLSDLRLLRRFWTVLRRERPAAFLGYTIKPNVYGSLAAQSLGIPVINNIAGLGETFLQRNWLNRLARRLYRIALRRSAVIFFQNQDQLDLFVRDRLVAEAAARLLPGSGIDLERFAPTKEPRHRNPDRMVFLMISRLLWAKGVGEFVEAARTVRRSYPGALFRLVGLAEDGQPSAVPKKALDGWVREGVIEFLASADDVRPFIRDADCLVLPTYYPEGTPRSLLEGAAMGKPLLTTDVSGCRDVVEDRINGYLCAPRDAESLAAGMRWMISQSDEQLGAMGRASRLKAERNYDERIVIERYLTAIKDVVRPDESA